MKNNLNNRTFKIAFCAVIAALAVVLMMLTSLVPIGTFAIPCIAGALFVSVVIEFNSKWALGIYLVVSILSVFLAGDKEAAVFFIAFFGYYPILKNLIERKITNKIVLILIKLLIFNAAMVASFFFASFVLGVSAEEYTVFGFYVPYLFLLAGNLFFFLYDRALMLFVVFYVRKISAKLFNKKR